jgi:lysophospholipase L1-like esterase
MKRVLKIAAGVVAAVLVLFGLVIASRALPHGGAIRIALVGDSTVAGYTDNPEWTEPFAFGFRGSLAADLMQAGCEFQFVGASPEPWNGKSGVPVLYDGTDLRSSGQDAHRGYGGFSYKDILLRLPGWLLVDDPDVIVLQAGINDLGPGAASASFGSLRALDAIGLVAAVFAPGSRLLVAEIAPYVEPTPAVAALNNYIAERFESVDLNSIFMSSGRPDPALFSNGVNHPNNAAYTRMAGAWAAAIIPVLRERGACRI